MVLLGSALGYGHDGDAVIASVFGAEVGDFDLHGLGGVQADARVHARLVGVAGGDAVDQDVVAGGAAAEGVDGVVTRERLDLIAGVHQDAGLELGEGGEVAVDDREVPDLFAGDNAGALAGVDLNGGAFGLDGDRFSDGADLQSQNAHAQVIAGRKLDVLFLEFLEAGLLGRDGVDAGGDGVKDEAARRIGGDGAHGAGVFGDEPDRGSRDGGSRRVGERTGDGAGSHLGRRQRWQGP